MVEQNPRNLRIEDYFYNLPEEKIACFPKERRDQSKLLIYRNEAISEDTYSGVSDRLPPGVRLVFNNTRVIQARLLFQKPTGAVIEIFLLEPEDEQGGLDLAINAKGRSVWKCLIGGAGKWKPGQVLSLNRQYLKLHAAVTGKNARNFLVEFTWEPASMSFSELLRLTGNIPIPPYLKRNPDLGDEERYQTIYAKKEGSVAAPTAGLHFTDELMNRLSSKGIEVSFLTLHVGAGTFLPVKSQVMDGHEMHGEYLDVEIQTIVEMLSSVGKMFAVGTTSLRTMESLYWMGVKVVKQPDIAADQIWVRQWEVYDELGLNQPEPAEALKALIEWMKKNGLERLMTKTEILIAPPYKPKTIRGLITNFHQPNSTLLLLVAAVIGESWKLVYNYALENDFRFLSYGDGCLLYTD